MYGNGEDGGGGDTPPVAGRDDVTLSQPTEFPSTGDDMNNNNAVNGLSTVKSDEDEESDPSEQGEMQKRDSIAPVHLVRPKGRSMKVTKAGRYTSDITMEEIQQHFHLPAYEAARRMGIGLTILKRLCRKFGLKRWPYQRKKFNPEEADAEMLLKKSQHNTNDFAIANSMSGGGTETNEFDTSHTTSKNNVAVRVGVQRQVPFNHRGVGDEETINVILAKLEGMRKSLLSKSQPSNGFVSRPQQPMPHVHQVCQGYGAFRPYSEHNAGLTTQQHPMYRNSTSMQRNAPILRPSGSFGGTSSHELVSSLLSHVRQERLANQSEAEVYEAILRAWDQMP